MNFPQPGSCLCGDVRYELLEDPLTLYVCHCTDCQSQTGSSFALSMIVRPESLRLLRGAPAEYSVTLPDGRVKTSRYCGRCSTRTWGRSRVRGLVVLEPGTLEDTSWLEPVGHIWTRSAQPWLRAPEGELCFAKQPEGDDWLGFVRAWKGRTHA